MKVAPYQQRIMLQSQKCTDESLDIKFDIIFDDDVAKIKQEKIAYCKFDMEIIRREIAIFESQKRTKKNESEINQSAREIKELISTRAQREAELDKLLRARLRTKEDAVLLSKSIGNPVFRKPEEPKPVPDMREYYSYY